MSDRLSYLKGILSLAVVATLQHSHFVVVFGSDGAGIMLDVEILTPAWMKPNLFGSLPFIGPAFETALLEVRERYPRLRFTQRLIYNESYNQCTDWATDSDRQTAQFYYQSRQEPMADKFQPLLLTTFIMAGCSELKGVQQLAAGLDKLVISTGTSNTYQHDKVNFPTLLSTSVQPISIYRTFYPNLLGLYGWSAMTIVTDLASNGVYERYARVIQQDLATDMPGVTVEFITVNFAAVVDVEQAILRRFRRSSRILLVATDGRPAKEILIHAYLNNMTDGTFVYIISQPLVEMYMGKNSGLYSTAETLILRTAYRSCLFESVDSSVLSLGSLSGQSHKFVHLWKEKARIEYNYTYGSEQEVIDEVLLHGPLSQLTDSARLAREFWNRTFTTKVGDLTFNEFGERILPLMVQSFRSEVNDFLLAFRQNPQTRKLDVIRLPDWPGPWPVPNEPRCGFRGNAPLCVAVYSRFVTSAACGTFLAIVMSTIACYAVARHIRNHRLLTHLWWRLDTALLIPHDLIASNYGR